MTPSDEISHLELSPTASTLSGVSEPTHYLPANSASAQPYVAARRGTIGSLHTNGSVNSTPSSNGTIVNGGYADGTMRSTTGSLSHSLSLSGSLSNSRTRSVSQSMSHSYLPSRGSIIPSPTLSSRPPPSYHSPQPLTPTASKHTTQPPAPPPPIAFATLMLLGNDRIRIAGFPDSCQELVRHVLSNGWTGVEGKRSPAPGVFEWKLAKTPCE